jgi:hypothetical protein
VRRATAPPPHPLPFPRPRARHPSPLVFRRCAALHPPARPSPPPLSQASDALALINRQAMIAGAFPGEPSVLEAGGKRRGVAGGAAGGGGGLAAGAGAGVAVEGEDDDKSM